MPGFSVHHQLPGLEQTHVHPVGAKQEAHLPPKQEKPPQLYKIVQNPATSGIPNQDGNRTACAQKYKELSCKVDSQPLKTTLLFAPQANPSHPQQVPKAQGNPEVAMLLLPPVSSPVFNLLPTSSPVFGGEGTAVAPKRVFFCLFVLFLNQGLCSSV